MIPRRRVTYRDTTLEEMDLPAILRRGARAVPDRRARAHQRRRASSTPSAIEDIEDVLAAGIDVFSTVNVQHLESLNDQVAELTGIRVRETVPDAVLGSADDVVLIDITPQIADRAAARRQGLPGRARRGGAEQLLQGREPVGAARGRAAPGGRGGRAQAASRPRPAGGTRGAPDRHRRPAGDRRAPAGADHAAARVPADRAPGLALGPATRAPSSTCCGSPTTSPARQEQEQLEALRRLASVLGAHLLIEHGDDVALTTQRVAQERGTTYVLMGTPKPRGAPSGASPDPRCRSGCSDCCPASTCASSPTGRR